MSDQTGFFGEDVLQLCMIQVAVFSNIVDFDRRLDPAGNKAHGVEIVVAELDHHSADVVLGPGHTKTQRPIAAGPAIRSCNSSKTLSTELLHDHLCDVIAHGVPLVNR